jgi:hypothetical protein
MDAEKTLTTEAEMAARARHAAMISDDLVIRDHRNTAIHAGQTTRRRAAMRTSPGSSDAASPDPLSPLFADLRGIAPLLIQAGSHEVLLDDATRLAATAAAADVAVQLEVAPEVPHVFQSFAGLLDEGEVALARAGCGIRLEFGSPGSGDDGSPGSLGDWRGRARAARPILAPAPDLWAVPRIGGLEAFDRTRLKGTT